jgi:tetratricopeptide (TPR) repeat protein
VNIYVLHLDKSFVDTFDVSNRSSVGSISAEMDVEGRGLETVAGAARGAVFRITAKPDWAFGRVASETSAYYLLSFEPDTADRDGKPHEIRVRVQRAGVTVRSRGEFVVGGARAAPKTAEEDVRALLTSPLLMSTLPLRVGAFVMRDAATTSVRTLVAADIDAGVTAPAEVTLGLTMSDAAGKVVGGFVKKETLKPYGSGPGACLKFSEAILVNPGLYTLKLAAVDSKGRRGSAVHSVVAEIPRAGGVETSDLLLIDPSGGEAEGGAPAVTSTIAGESVGLYMEIYYPRSLSVKQVQVTLEIGSNAESPALFTRSAAVVDRPAQRRWVAAEVIDAPLLPPGDYVARALVVLDGRPVGRALRLFHMAAAGGGAGTAGGGAPRNLAVFGSGSTLVRPFVRFSVLGPDVVGYFVSRMEKAGEGPSTPAVVAATGHARALQFDLVLSDLAESGSDALAVPFLRGLARLSKGDLNSAMKDFQEALRISSEFLPAAFYLGACYAAGGKDRDAAGAWQTALISESDARIVYDVLADAYIRLRDAEQAEAILKEAREKWPDDDVFVPRLAAALALSGRDPEALSVLDSYVNRRPADDQALFLAMRLLYEASAKGRAVRSTAEDRADFVRYAKLYDATSGTNKEIVARWLKSMESAKR